MGFEFIMRRYPLMFCPHCGNNVADNTKFCPYCGATMEQQAPAAAPQQPPVGGPASYAPQQNSVPNYGAPQQTPYVPNYAAAQKAAKPKYMNPIALIAAAVTLIAMSLPFTSIYGYSRSFFTYVTYFDLMSYYVPFAFFIFGYGLIFLMVVIVILQISKATQVSSVVLAAVSLFLLLIEISIIAASDLFAYGGSIGIGFWLMLIGLIVIIVSGPIYKAIFKK